MIWENLEVTRTRGRQAVGLGLCWKIPICPCECALTADSSDAKAHAASDPQCTDWVRSSPGGGGGKGNTSGDHPLVVGVGMTQLVNE